MINGDKVLLQKFNGDKHWCLPGGRIHLFENTPSAVLRELKEGTGAAATIIRFVCSCENMFKYNDRIYHEIGFYYLVAFPLNIKKEESTKPTKPTKPCEASETIEATKFYETTTSSTSSKSCDTDDTGFADIDDNASIFKWHSVNSLSSLRLCPSFLEDRLEEMCKISISEFFHVIQEKIDDINNYTN